MAVIRRLLLVTFALILSWAGVVQPGLGALASPAEFVHVYAHDSHHHTAVLTFTTTERGPPAGYSNATAYDADGMLPSGDLARPEDTTPATYDYDDAARFVQTARGSDAAGKQGGDPMARPAAVWRSSVATKVEAGAVKRGGWFAQLRCVRHCRGFNARWQTGVGDEHLPGATNPWRKRADCAVRWCLLARSRRARSDRE